MADMHGAVRSSYFKVKDVDAFKRWFAEHVQFGDNIDVWDNDDGVAFGSYEMYPSAWPNHPADEDEDIEAQPWDLDAFAAELRQHLLPGETFNVVAAGNEKLRYVGAQQLIITHDDVKWSSFYAGN